MYCSFVLVASDSVGARRELEHVSSKFEIESAVTSDSGRYECQASNPFGKSYYHIQLQIWGKRNYFCYRLNRKWFQPSFFDIYALSIPLAVFIQYFVYFNIKEQFQSRKLMIYYALSCLIITKS